MTDISRLPRPVAETWDWQLRAACRESGIEIFFHPDNERGQARSRRDEAAKAICFGCPVLSECRRHALTVREPYGVWGGLSEDDRAGLETQSAGKIALNRDLPGRLPDAVELAASG